MGSWINNTKQFSKGRNNPFNSLICTDKLALNRMTADFDSIFGSFNSYRDTIGAIHFYPIVLPFEKYADSSGVENDLETANKSTDIEVYHLRSDYYYYYLGQFKVERYFNNFADYKGYTSIKVFLPLLGFMDVDVNECMGKWLQFRLYVDFYTGKGMYIIGVTENEIIMQDNIDMYVLDNNANMRVIGNYSTDIAVDVPVGSSNVGDIKRNLAIGAVKTAVGIGLSVAGAMSGSPVSTQTTQTNYEVMGRTFDKGARLKVMERGSETRTSTRTYSNPYTDVITASEAFSNAIETISRVHPTGSCDRVNDCGLLLPASKYVQVVIYRPRMVSIDEEYNYLYGQPLGETKQLSSVRGYTEISSIHIKGDGFAEATQEEITNIQTILNGGVFL